MRNIIILGSGAVADELTFFIEDNNSKVNENEKINILGYIEYSHNIEKYYNEYNFTAPVLCDIDSYKPSLNEEVIIGISNLSFKKKIIKILLEKKAKIGSFIHHSVLIPKSTNIGKGTIIYPFCIIEQNSVIGDYNIIGSYSYVSHNSIIGNNNFFSTGGMPTVLKIGNDNYFRIGSH